MGTATNTPAPPIDHFGITCLECGRTFKRSMAGHVWYAHGLLKHDYYRKNKLPLGSRLATNEFRKSYSKMVKERPQSQIQGRVVIKNTDDAVRIATTLPHNGHRNTKGRPLTPEWKEKVVAAARETGRRRYQVAHEERTCGFCNKVFMALIKRKSKYCSAPCRQKGLGPASSKRLSQPEVRAKAASSLSKTRKRKYWRTAPPAKLENIVCKFCKKEFVALKRQHRTTCSLSCTGKLGGRASHKSSRKQCPPPNHP